MKHILKWTMLFCMVFVLAKPVRAVKLPDRAPKYLSDLYKYLTYHLEKGLVPGLKIKYSIVGRSWNILKTGEFHRVESELKEFNWKGLRFLKAHFEFVDMQVDPQALAKWEMKIQSLKESRSSMVFSLKSLEKKLRKSMGEKNLELRADIAKQEIIFKGTGHVFWVPTAYITRTRARWDADSNQLWLDPVRVQWAGIEMPAWMWWLGEGSRPKKAILDLSGSWIPYNIQEVNLGWDRISLSTDW